MINPTIPGESQGCTSNPVAVTGVGWCRSVWLNGTCTRDEVFMMIDITLNITITIYHITS
jgi:hypothetical protein